MIQLQAKTIFGYTAVCLNRFVRCRGAGHMKTRIIIRVIFQMDGADLQIFDGLCDEPESLFSRCRGLMACNLIYRICYHTCSVRRSC